MKPAIVTGTVIAIVPDYRQVKVRDADGRLYSAVVGHTLNLDLNAHHEGERVTLDVEWIGDSPKVTAIHPAP